MTIILAGATGFIGSILTIGSEISFIRSFFSTASRRRIDMLLTERHAVPEAAIELGYVFNRRRIAVAAAVSGAKPR